MACGTCDHTMQCIASGGPASTYWCPRCGTLRTVIRSREETQTKDEAPMLVTRCQKFEETIHHVDDIAEWKRLGIAESINVPEEQPK